MSLVSTKQMLLDARKDGYAIGAFNVENMEIMQAAVAAAEELRAPVILQANPSVLEHVRMDYFYAMAKAAAKAACVPVAIHLDHGDGFELVMQALRMGFSSVMFDGSHRPFEENVELTKKTVEACLPSDIPVEAELGKVGGREGNLDGGAGECTEPLKAKEFVERTGVTSLAVSIGNAHGVYTGTPKLNLEVLEEIHRLVKIPLVLHGASGLSDEALKACISRGICKINYATELRMAYSEGVKKAFAEKPELYDPKKYGAAGREIVKQLVMNRMRVCGCEGRAI